MSAPTSSDLGAWELQSQIDERGFTEQQGIEALRAYATSGAMAADLGVDAEAKPDAQATDTGTDDSKKSVGGLKRLATAVTKLRDAGD